MVLVTSSSNTPVKTIACSVGLAWLSAFVLLRRGFFFFLILFLTTHFGSHLFFVFQISTVGKSKMLIFTNAQLKISFEMLVAISTALQPSNVHTVRSYNNCIILIRQIDKRLILFSIQMY